MFVAEDTWSRGQKGLSRTPVNRPDPTDAELIEAMLRGDENAVRTFFRIYFPRLRKFAVRRVHGDLDMAQEAAQRTLTNALRGLPRYRGDSALFTWLCRICSRQIVDLIRSNAKHARHLARAEHESEARVAITETHALAAHHPDEEYHASQMRALIRSALGNLPHRYGDVLQWKYIDERSVEEIAHLLGMGITAAQSMLARARAAFRASYVPVD
jgi:RNA polymerase sigma-70 factor, ECF subfamily